MLSPLLFCIYVTMRPHYSQVWAWLPLTTHKYFSGT
uniref:Uncharacterized protein n=1 Tax=Anguilla anguilla TaxID=7936 RepID=A0A0E9UPR9_ANGAN